MSDVGALAAELGRVATADETAHVVAGLPANERALVYAALHRPSSGATDELPRAVAALAGALAARAIPVDDLAAALLHAHLPREAIRALEVASGGREHSARLMNTRGVALMMLGEVDEAIHSFEGASRLEPSYDVPAANLANAYVMSGRLALAEGMFTRLLSTPRVRPTVLANLARLRLLQRRFEDALEACRMALAVDDRCVQAHINLCCTFYEKGEISASIASGNRAVEVGADSPEALYFLGRSLVANGEDDRAVHCFKEALKLRPEYLDASYALAVLGRCETAPREMPRPLIQRLFDEYAEFYDQHLRDTLHYSVPDQLVRLFHRVRQDDAVAIDVVDLGCGTGLTGLAFHSLCRSLVGVDVSPGMLRVCASRGIYAALHLADASEFLMSVRSAFDLGVVGDAVAYIGDLEPLFAAARKALRAGGWLLLSAEATQGSGYALSRTGRFQHSSSYLCEAASRNGFGRTTVEAGVGRTEADAPVPCIFLATQLLEK